MNQRQRIAIPVSREALSTHFGHCETFSIIDTEDGKIISHRQLAPPPHQPGVYPPFLAGQGVNVVITGGIGQRAIELFLEQGIDVYTGVKSGAPEDLARAFLDKRLEAGENLCDH